MVHCTTTNRCVRTAVLHCAQQETVYFFSLALDAVNILYNFYVFYPVAGEQQKEEEKKKSVKTKKLDRKNGRRKKLPPGMLLMIPYYYVRIILLLLLLYATTTTTHYIRICIRTSYIRPSSQVMTPIRGSGQEVVEISRVDPWTVVLYTSPIHAESMDTVLPFVGSKTGKKNETCVFSPRKKMKTGISKTFF